MALVTRARIGGIVAICLLMIGAPVALAEAGSAFQPDAQVRRGNGSYTGGDVINTDATGQSVFNTGVVDQKLTFFILIENDGFTFPETFKVKRSAGFHNGYRVRFYDQANNDVTGKVTTGTFTTPPLDAFGAEDYVMRVTVKIRPQATPCSFTTRLITVRSASSPTVNDAVRFTAALDTPALNCAPVAVNDTASITENAVSVTGNMYANDIDPDGDPISLATQNFAPPSYHVGWQMDASTGAYTWFLDNSGPVDALNSGDILTQVIQYSVEDFNGLTSNIATLTVTIHGVTDPD